MDIFSYGTIYDWEIVVGLIITGVVLWLGIRATRKSERRHGAGTKKEGD